MNWLYLLLSVIAVDAQSSQEKCPRLSLAYPELKDTPESCYLLLDWTVVYQFWTEIWKGPKLGYTVDKKALEGLVWDPDHARNICSQIHLHSNYAHLKEFQFRLPIIETSDENSWLYDKAGTLRFRNFWIDLEFDHDNGAPFWVTTGIEPTYVSYPENVNPEWDGHLVLEGSPDGEFRTCYEFVLNHDQYDDVRGWHQRACAQAYTRKVQDEYCEDKIPYTYHAIYKPWAPTNVVCEFPVQGDVFTGSTQYP